MRTICNLIGIDIIFSNKQNYKILIPKSNRIMLMQSQKVGDEYEQIVNFSPMKKNNLLFIVTKEIAQECYLRDDFYVIQDYEKKSTYILAYSIIKNPFFRDYYEKEKNTENALLLIDNEIQDESQLTPDYNSKYRMQTNLKDYVEYKKIL